VAGDGAHFNVTDEDQTAVHMSGTFTPEGTVA